MRIDESTYIPEFDARLLDPSKLIDYLNTRGWTERAGAGRELVKVYYRRENRVMEVSVPLITEQSNYADILARSVAVISQFENRSQLDIYSDLLFYADDVIELADKDADTANGTVSVPRADHLFAGIRKALLSAAHMEIEPKQHYVRLQQGKGELFISRCRLGQTKRGSYIMTVTCPLNAVPTDLNTHVPPFPHFGFTRGVTTRLMASVHHLAQSAEKDDVTAATQATDANMMLSTNLCDGLLQLMPENPGGRVDIGVRWAKKQPFDDEKEAPSVVTLKHEYRPFVESVRVSLRSSHVTDAKQLFFGRVDSLAGEVDSEGHKQGKVIFRVTDEDQETRMVRVLLSATDHHNAWVAYEKNSVVSFRGILRIASGSLYQVDEYSDFQIIIPESAT